MTLHVSECPDDLDEVVETYLLGTLPTEESIAFEDHYAACDNVTTACLRDRASDAVSDKLPASGLSYTSASRSNGSPGPGCRDALIRAQCPPAVLSRQRCPVCACPGLADRRDGGAGDRAAVQ